MLLLLLSSSSYLCVSCRGHRRRSSPQCSFRTTRVSSLRARRVRHRFAYLPSASYRGRSRPTKVQESSLKSSDLPAALARHTTTLLCEIVFFFFIFEFGYRRKRFNFFFLFLRLFPITPLPRVSVCACASARASRSRGASYLLCIR